MLLQSLHTHSLYDDGQDTLARMAQNAEAAGLDALGFSGHGPLPFANDWAIDQSCLADYLREVTSLNPAHIKSSGRGDYVPIADNATAEGRALNRRVVIKIYNSYNSEKE